MVISNKNSYASRRLKAEAENRGARLDILDVEDLLSRGFRIDLAFYRTLYIRDPYYGQSAEYLPEVVKLARDFQAAGKRVVDAAVATGALGQGKWLDYQKLKLAGLPIPKTELLSENSAPAVFPLILKWNFGLRGRNVCLTHNLQDLQLKSRRHPQSEWLVQEFISAEFEYKVVTVGYKSLPVVLKFKMNGETKRPDFANYEVLSNNKAVEVISLAETAARTLGRELAKVDILENQGNFYILEVNRFPGLKSFERLTKYNAVSDFLAYLQM